MAASSATRPSPNTRGLVQPTESSAEPFRTLRVGLELVPDSGRGNLMLFTSASPGEGKSTVAANYALVSAVNDRMRESALPSRNYSGLAFKFERNPL